MKKQNLYSAWLYEFDVCYDAEGKVFHESFNVISHKGYCDIGYQFPKFILPEIEKFYHDHDFKVVHTEIVNLSALNW